MERINWQKAEEVAGHRLDRRLAYAIPADGAANDDGTLFFAVSWTDSCTGCTNTTDGYPDGHYPTDPKHHCLIGSGCPECGYTGKRRHAYWVPVDGCDCAEAQGGGR